MGFSDLKTRYAPRESIVVADLPEGTASVALRDAFGARHAFGFDGKSAYCPEAPDGTHAVEALSLTDELLGEEFTTVCEGVGKVPVIGFASSFEDDRVDEVLAWLRMLRCTTVQLYDWMERYTAPLPGRDRYRDPVGRSLSRRALRRLISEIRTFGAAAQAYAPVCAADPDFADLHSDWVLERNDGGSERLGDLLVIMDPGNADWQAHWIGVYREAAGALGFDGFHLDTYGFPRVAFDASRVQRSMRAGYRSFINRLRDADREAVVSFNQVNGVPDCFSLPAPPSYRYVEVWPPNDRFTHLEGLMARSADAGSRNGIYALYPPVWDKDRSGAVATVVQSLAIATMLGGAALSLGDTKGALSHPYYPNFERLGDGEAATVLAWHRFALRCRDLFSSGADTSWVEIGDENGTVELEANGTDVRPEPQAGAVFARVARHESTIAIGCLDLTASESASWMKPSGFSTPRTVRVRVLAPAPAHAGVEAAVLGDHGDRFLAVPFQRVEHREGTAIEFELPVIAGWSVARVHAIGATR